MTAMRLKRYPSPSGGIALGKMGVGATMLKQGKTARDYVQDGLIAMWDGIENAGWGVHDQNATVWTNLIDNTFSLTINNGGYWTDKSLSCDSLLTNGLAYNTGLISNAMQIEICCNVTSKGSPSAFLVTNGEISYQKQQNVCINSRTNGVQTSFARVWVSYIRTTGVHFLSARWNDLFANGEKITGGTGSEAVASGTDNLNIFGRRSGSNYSVAGDVFNVRLYSRALTAAEIAANYAIDKERFNLP